MKRLAALALVASCATPTAPTVTLPKGSGRAPERVTVGTVSAPSPVKTLRVTAPKASRTRPFTGLTASGSGSLTNSTAYCETGLMANGQHTYRGAVAGNLWKLGTRLRVSDSPYGPGVFTVADRIGHSSQLDFAMPGDCTGALRWGRRDVHVEVLGR